MGYACKFRTKPSGRKEFEVDVGPIAGNRAAKEKVERRLQNNQEYRDYTWKGVWTQTQELLMLSC